MMPFLFFNPEWEACPATRLLQKISGKWKGIILYRFIQQSTGISRTKRQRLPLSNSDARSSTCATMRRWLHSKTYSNNPATRHNLQSFNGGGDGTETDYSCYCTVGGIIQYSHLLLQLTPHNLSSLQ